MINTLAQIITPPSRGVPTSFFSCKPLKIGVSFPSKDTFPAFFFHISFLYKYAVQSGVIEIPTIKEIAAGKKTLIRSRIIINILDNF